MNLIKHIPLAAVLVSAPFFLASCGEKKADADAAETHAETAQTSPAAKPYPLDTCIVSGEELGSMGDAYIFVHQGQEVKMCCKKCLKKFNANPEKYLALIQKGQPANDGHDHSGHQH